MEYKNYYKALGLKTDILRATEVKYEIHRDKIVDIAKYIESTENDGMIWLIIPQG